MSTVDQLVRILIILCLPVTLILAPMHLFTTPGFVSYEYGLSHVPASIRFDAEERLAISDVILDYVRGRVTREELEAVRTTSQEQALNDREVDHLQDVAEVMQGLSAASGLAFSLAGLGIVYLASRRKPALLGSALSIGAGLSGAIIIAVVGASLIDFDTFFRAFHGIFFAEGTWLFYYEDTLIQLYPLPFWVDAVWKMGAIILAAMIAVFAIGQFLLRPTVNGQTRSRPRERTQRG